MSDVEIIQSSTPGLGSIYLPRGAGTPVGAFDFIVDRDARGVEIGTPVAADTGEGTLVGTVIDMRTVGTASDPVSEDWGSGPTKPIVDSHNEVMLATVQVFSSDRLRPARSGVVRAASAEEMLRATGYDRMDWRVPAGVVGLADGTYAPVCFDGRALLGPESAHLIINGLSGQAAKTSYAGVLLASAIASGNREDSVGALIFNVKGDDLVYLDRPPEPGFELSEDDRGMYEALGIPAAPFRDVTVYSPSLPGGGGSQSAREEALALRWGLQEIWPYLEFILPYYGDDEKASTFLAEFRDAKIYNPDVARRVTSFNELGAFFDTYANTPEEAAEHEHLHSGWGNHHYATLGRMRRALMGIVARTGGLVSKEKVEGNEDVPVSDWRHGQVIVVDIAGLHTDIQGLVIGRTLRRLLEQAESEGIGVDHLVVLADELNAFAPSVGTEMARVRRILQRVSTQGRYAGISLWGAAQKTSKIDELVRDNAATRAIGITSDAELASGVYGRLSAGQVERLATLPRGSMALSHYSFRGQLVVKFPRPAWRTGKAKTGSVRKKAVDSLKLSDKSLARLSEGIDPETRDRIIAEADDSVLAIENLQASRVPDMDATVLHERSTAQPNDPFGLGEFDI